MKFFLKIGFANALLICLQLLLKPSIEREKSVDRIPRKNGKLNVIHFTLNTSRSNKNDLFKFAL
jgi:hypothetical protein